MIARPRAALVPVVGLVTGLLTALVACASPSADEGATSAAAATEGSQEPQPICRFGSAFGGDSDPWTEISTDGAQCFKTLNYPWADKTPVPCVKAVRTCVAKKCVQSVVKGRKVSELRPVGAGQCRELVDDQSNSMTGKKDEAHACDDTTYGAECKTVMEVGGPVVKLGEPDPGNWPDNAWAPYNP